MEEEKKEDSSMSTVLDAVKELTKTVADLVKEIEISRKAGKF